MITSGNINTRKLINYISLSVKQIMENYIFEPNDQMSRNTIKRNIDYFLQKQVDSRRGLNDYKVICNQSNNSSRHVDRGNLVVDVYLKPTAAIQFVHLSAQIIPDPHPLKVLGLNDTYDIVRWKDEL